MSIIDDIKGDIPLIILANGPDATGHESVPGEERTFEKFVLHREDEWYVKDNIDIMLTRCRNFASHYQKSIIRAYCWRSQDKTTVFVEAFYGDVG